MRSVIQLPTSPVGYVRVELGRRKIGMSEHFLNRPEVRASLEQVRGEGVAEEMRVDALRIEPRLVGEFPQDQEGAGPGQRASASVQEELGPVARVEERAPTGEVAP